MLERILRESENSESSLEPTLLQGVCREAWQATKSFAKYSQEKQDAAIKALESVGIIAVSKCEGNWNSRRWIDVWDELSSQEYALVQSSVSLTTPAAMRSAFKNLFQMLEVGVPTMDELQEVKRLNRQRQVVARGGMSRSETKLKLFSPVTNTRRQR